MGLRVNEGKKEKQTRTEEKNDKRLIFFYNKGGKSKANPGNKETKSPQYKLSFLAASEMFCFSGCGTNKCNIIIFFGFSYYIS